MKTKNKVSVIEGLNESMLEQLKGGKAQVLAISAVPSATGDGALISCCNKQEPNKFPDQR